MKKILIILFTTFCCFISFAFAQKLNKPELIGTWKGGEDFREFLSDKIERMAYEVKENPDSKVIARVCSKYESIPLALMSSVGFAYDFLGFTEFEGIPNNRIYLATSLKCLGGLNKTFEEYWIVPKGADLEYRKIISAENVDTKRFFVSYYKNYESLSARKEFNNHIGQFIKYLKDSPKSQGFIVSNWNSQKIELNIQAVLRQIRQKEVDTGRIRVVRKKSFYNLYPELFVITVSQ